MSLILIYHDQRFAIVGSDGRVSRHEDNVLERLLERWTPKRMITVPNVVHKKFVTLRPGLVLAGSSSFGTAWDYFAYESARRHVEMYPDAKFDEIARVLETAAHEQAHTLRVPQGESLHLNLVGRDQGRMRVRAFRFGPTTTHEEPEGDCGVSLGTPIESDEEVLPLANELAKYAQSTNQDGIQKRMLEIMEQISAMTPVTVGPPYFFEIVGSMRTAWGVGR